MDYFKTQTFGRFVCDGDNIVCEVDGFTVTATVYDDDNREPPWTRDDGHGPVSEWRDADAKEPGERVLCSDHGRARFYDFAEAVKIAARDWIGPGKRGEGSRKFRAAKAAEQDYEALRAWCNDEWRYVGVAVRVSKGDVDLTGKYHNALWGIEANYPDSDNAYLAEVANDLVGDALTEARAAIASLTA